MKRSLRPETAASLIITLGNTPNAAVPTSRGAQTGKGGLLGRSIVIYSLEVGSVLRFLLFDEGKCN